MVEANWMWPTFSDQDGELTNVEGLADACRGYISYVRGGDPATFPTQLSPSVRTGKPCSRWPKLGIDGKATKQPTGDDKNWSPLPPALYKRPRRWRPFIKVVFNEWRCVFTSTDIYYSVPRWRKSVEDQIKCFVWDDDGREHAVSCGGSRVCSEKMNISKDFDGSGLFERVSRNRHGIHVLIPRNLTHGIRSRGSGIHSRAEGPPLLDTKTPRTVRYAIITGTDLTTESSKIQILKKSKISRMSMDPWFRAVGHTDGIGRSRSEKYPWSSYFGSMVEHGSTDQIIGRARSTCHTYLCQNPKGTWRSTMYVCWAETVKESITSTSNVLFRSDQLSRTYWKCCEPNR
jgi:hypothetical protein